MEPNSSIDITKSTGTTTNTPKAIINIVSATLIDAGKSCNLLNPFFPYIQYDPCILFDYRVPCLLIYNRC